MPSGRFIFIEWTCVALVMQRRGIVLPSEQTALDNRPESQNRSGAQMNFSARSEGILNFLGT